jgi:NTE family protein
MAINRGIGEGLRSRSRGGIDFARRQQMPDALPRHAAIPPRPASYDKSVALVLQGGGALGSYQAGVYEALSSSPYVPDWVAGISIGAINAAIIAGNAPERRVAQLRLFWETITEPPPLWPSSLDRRELGTWRALVLGQPGFYSPRLPFSWLQPAGPPSIYDTSALRSTLEKVVDFDRINAKEVRFSVAATDIESGNFAWFDNNEIRIGPEHVMASGALPPGFPAVEIDGRFYWDGGIVSNTPLQYVIESQPRVSRLAFQIDLFPARGKLPTNLVESAEREKDIRFSSRTRAGTDQMRLMQNLQHAYRELWEKLPPALQTTPEAQLLYSHSRNARQVDIAHLIDRSTHRGGHDKDIEFSRTTMTARWAQGLRDAQETLVASPWLTTLDRDVGLRSFDVGEKD